MPNALSGFIRWYTALPVGLVGSHSLMAGTVVSAINFEGVPGGNYTALAGMTAPIVLWLGCVRIERSE